MNRRHRGKEYASNVLSFPANMPEAAVDASGSRMLGDIALCPEVIEAEARQQGKALEAHWAHLTIHGALHLTGHHHSEAEAAAAMEAIETESLKKLGFPDPYLVV